MGVARRAVVTGLAGLLRAMRYPDGRGLSCRLRVHRGRKDEPLDVRSRLRRADHRRASGLHTSNGIDRMRRRPSGTAVRAVAILVVHDLAPVPEPSGQPDPEIGPELGMRQTLTLASWSGSAGRDGSGGLGVPWPARFWPGSGDGAQGDFEAEGAELADVVCDLPADAGPALVVVRAEILVSHAGASLRAVRLAAGRRIRVPSP